MNSPIRLKLTTVDMPRLVASAKKAKVFEKYSDGGIVELKVKNIYRGIVEEEIAKYPELLQGFKGRTLHVSIPNEDIFLLLMLAITDAELTQYKDLNEYNFRMKRRDILRELRRHLPFVSATYFRLEEEALRTVESLEETMERLTGKGHFEDQDDSQKKSVEQILEEVKSRREQKTTPNHPSGLLG